MPMVLSTLQTVSTPRQSHLPSQKPPPIPAQQQMEKLEAHQEKQQQIDDAVSEWYIAKADELRK